MRRSRVVDRGKLSRQNARHLPPVVIPLLYSTRSWLDPALSCGGDEGKHSLPGLNETILRELGKIREA